MGDFLKVLPVVASSPLALIGYAAALVAWILVGISTRRTKSLFRTIRSLPEADRIQAIEMEYRTTPRNGLTAEQWLQSRRSLFLLIGFGATILAVVLIAALGYGLLMGETKANHDHMLQSANELADVLDERAEGVLSVFHDIERGEVDSYSDDDKPLPPSPDLLKEVSSREKEFSRLHGEVKSALRKGNLVLVHELIEQIDGLLRKRYSEEQDPDHAISKRFYSVTYVQGWAPDIRPYIDALNYGAADAEKELHPVQH